MLQVDGVNKVSVFQLQMLCSLEPASLFWSNRLCIISKQFNKARMQYCQKSLLCSIVLSAVLFLSFFWSLFIKYFNVVQLYKLHLWLILNPEAFPSKLLHRPAGRYGMLWFTWLVISHPLCVCSLCRRICWKMLFVFHSLPRSRNL